MSDFDFPESPRRNAKPTHPMTHLVINTIASLVGTYVGGMLVVFSLYWYVRIEVEKALKPVLEAKADIGPQPGKR